MAVDEETGPDVIELSVIVPTIGRCERVQACLEALAHQTLSPESFEVIVVIDGVDPRTEDMLARFDAPYALRCFPQKNGGPGAARNTGSAAARGGYCLFLDDDMIVERQTLTAHLRAQRECRGAVAAGKILLRMRPDADWFASWFARAWDAHYKRLDAQARPAGWLDCYSGNFSVPTDAFRRVGGFATDLVHSEDVELGYRLVRQNVPVVYVPDATSVQDERKGISELTADAEMAGMACVELCRRYPELTSELLGWFRRAHPAERMARRVLLAWDVEPRRFAPIGSVLRARPDSCGQMLHHYCYWRGVRKAIGDTAVWKHVCAGAIDGGLSPASAHVSHGSHAARTALPTPPSRCPQIAAAPNTPSRPLTNR